MTTSTTNGTDYALVNGVLSVNNGFSGTITSTATFNNEVQTKEIDFIYDHNGMRTGKIVSENGRVEITEYTLHGKLITHLTKRTVDEEGNETTQELHFFFDAQFKPAFVEFEGVKYRYVHNLQGDIVAIVDSAGNAVVEYNYDAWGSLISMSGSMLDILGKFNPFRYRSYIYDEETELYYLRSRYYKPRLHQFINCDAFLGKFGTIGSHNLFAYTRGNPINNIDSDGYSSNPFPFHSTPFDYQNYLFEDGVLYERWYNAYGWPQVDRHWTDHNKPWAHSAPHDHYWDSSDPTQPPSHTDRNTKNNPELNWPGQDKWKKEKEEHESNNKNSINTSKYVQEGAKVVAIGYGIYRGIKALIALAAAIPTSGTSLSILVVP